MAGAGALAAGLAFFPPPVSFMMFLITEAASALLNISLVLESR